METRVDEIGDRVYRISTCIPDVAPGGFTFNQFLLDADEPLLFHCGLRLLFPQVQAAVSSVVPLERLRWIGFGHVEADECGAMNAWLAAAHRAQVIHGQVGCMVSINDLADRPPRPLAHGETLDLGGRRVRLLATPHVPHNWEAVVLFEEATRTLLAGDLFSQAGDGPAIVETSLLEPALAAERAFSPVSALAPETGPTLRALAALEPTTIAVMHGSSYRGDGGGELRGLADAYARLALERQPGGPAAPLPE